MSVCVVESKGEDLAPRPPAPLSALAPSLGPLLSGPNPFPAAATLPICRLVSPLVLCQI